MSSVNICHAAVPPVLGNISKTLRVLTVGHILGIQPMEVFLLKLTRKLTRAALSVTAAGAIVLGTAVSASAYRDPDVSGCLNFVHTNHWYKTTHKVVGTNTCGVGPFSFRIHNWGNVGNHEWTPCFWVDAGRSAGWEWTRGRPSYDVIAC
jgi:hypothetical protein